MESAASDLPSIILGVTIESLYHSTFLFCTTTRLLGQCLPKLIEYRLYKSWFSNPMPWLAQCGRNSDSCHHSSVFVLTTTSSLNSAFRNWLYKRVDYLLMPFDWNSGDAIRKLFLPRNYWSLQQRLVWNNAFQTWPNIDPKTRVSFILCIDWNNADANRKLVTNHRS